MADTFCCTEFQYKENSCDLASSRARAAAAAAAAVAAAAAAVAVAAAAAAAAAAATLGAASFCRRCGNAEPHPT
jgi:hypothetical protein